MQKESFARALKNDLLETKEQINMQLYKSVKQYLLLFNSTIRERDPSLDNG
jgi:hypothetical protein